jgi:hypothetical protein
MNHLKEFSLDELRQQLNQLVTSLGEQWGWEKPYEWDDFVETQEAGVEAAYQVELRKVRGLFQEIQGRLESEGEESY